MFVARLPVVLCFVLVGLLAADVAFARKAALLEVSKGQIPNDTGSDGLTKMSIEERPELGGRALKVVYHAGDSFGERQARVANWKEFITLEFDAFNPAKEHVRLSLTVKHRRSTSYETRIDMPVTLKPGKNFVRIGIDEMMNVNGTTPDLTEVGRWYFACEPGTTPTLYFGDIYLVGDDTPPASAAGSQGGAQKITGKIGDMPVDIVQTPRVDGPGSRITGRIGDMTVDLTTTPLGGILASGVAAPQAAGQRAKPRATALLHVSQGQLPNDTGGESTKYALDEKPELGGKCMRVDFGNAHSFGGNPPTVQAWNGYLTLEFEVFNPGQQNQRMVFAIKHSRTTSYQTRAEVPFDAKPGKNSIKINLDEVTNVNGSAPQLSSVRHWYINPESTEALALYFGDFWLLDPGATKPAPGVPVASAPAGGAPEGVIKTDPDRLARIRAAKMPKVTKPVLFCTPEADAICSALEVFPPDNPWNQLVEDWPVHPNSNAIIGSIGPEKPFRYNPDMSFIFVPPDQEQIEVKLTGYPGESDPGPYPVPDGIPIEGWPGYFSQFRDKVPPLEEVQRGTGGDRHGIVVDPTTRMLYEFFVMQKTDDGWQATQASIFDLKTNKLRPLGWTSADAAGLPIFPAVVRYDEIKRGIVEHAMRVTVTKTRREFVAPATHYASPHTNPEYPRMGERLRLKANFDISDFSPEVQAILKGLRKYGMFVADNGIDWAISVAPDPRLPKMHEEFRRIKGAAFEVVVPPQ